MAHIYITNNGSNMAVEGGRFLIKKDGITVKTVPMEACESVTIFGNSHMTIRCTQELLSRKIPVCYFSNRGKYYGRLESIERCDVSLMRKQLELFDNEEITLELSRRIIDAKVNNQGVLVRRYVKDEDICRELKDEIKHIRNKIGNASFTEQLMGYEGQAAKLYFNALSGAVPAEFSFSGRSRRPPEDEFNSMLNLGYTLVLREIYSNLQIEGLNPYLGVMHRSRSNFPALASDLVEEWRATLIDGLVLGMINRKEIKKDDFYYDNKTGGVYLSNEGLKKYINCYERKVNMQINYLEGNSCTFREALNIQCRALKDCIIQDNIDLYKPILIR